MSYIRQLSVFFVCFIFIASYTSSVSSQSLDVSETDQTIRDQTSEQMDGLAVFLANEALQAQSIADDIEAGKFASINDISRGDLFRWNIEPSAFEIIVDDRTDPDLKTALQLNTAAAAFREVSDDLTSYTDRLQIIRNDIAVASTAQDLQLRLESEYVPPTVKSVLDSAIVYGGYRPSEDEDAFSLEQTISQGLIPYIGFGPDIILGVDPLIVGPGARTSADYPSVAALLFGGPSSNPQGSKYHYKTKCTGTLIESNIVLTAAHCFCEVSGKSFRSYSACDAGTYQHGSETLTTTTPDPYLVFFQHAGEFEVEKIIISPQYVWPNDKLPTADLALIVLKEPVIGIQPAKVNTSSTVNAGMFGRIVGFGRHDQLDSTGRSIPGSAVGYATGLKLHAGVLFDNCDRLLGTVPSDLLCWRYTGGRNENRQLGSTCHGDSGGPAFANFGNEIVLVGVTSGITYTPNGQGCVPNTIAFDIDIKSHQQWLQSEISIYPASISRSQTKKVAKPIYHRGNRLFSRVNEPWPEAFMIESRTEMLRVTVNATSGTLPIELSVEHTDGQGDQNCSTQQDHTVLSCEIANPKPGIWQATVTGSPSRRFQTVAVTY